VSIILHDYQTLIAGTLSAVVALLVLWQACRQFGISRVQSLITKRGLLIERLATAERERQHTAEQMQKMTNDLAREIFPGGEETGEPDVDPNWAHSADQQVHWNIGELSDRQESKADPQVVDEPRRRLIDAAKALRNCLSQLHQWTSVDFEDPDYNFADPAAEEKKAIIARDDATKEIGQRINAVRSAARELDGAFETVIKDFRSRLRQIDELVHEKKRAEA
jgi:hypothetical protein